MQAVPVSPRALRREPTRREPGRRQSVEQPRAADLGRRLQRQQADDRRRTARARWRRRPRRRCHRAGGRPGRTAAGPRPAAAGPTCRAGPATRARARRAAAGRRDRRRRRPAGAAPATSWPVRWIGASEPKWSRARSHSSGWSGGTQAATASGAWARVVAASSSRHMRTSVAGGKRPPALRDQPAQDAPPRGPGGSPAGRRRSVRLMRAISRTTRSRSASSSTMAPSMRSTSRRSSSSSGSGGLAMVRRGSRGDGIGAAAPDETPLRRRLSILGTAIAQGRAGATSPALPVATTASRRRVRPARGLVDRIVGHIVGDPLLRQHRRRSDCPGSGPRRRDRPPARRAAGRARRPAPPPGAAARPASPSRRSETVLGDDIVLAVAGAAEELKRRRPIVAAAVIVGVGPVLPAVDEARGPRRPAPAAACRRGRAAGRARPWWRGSGSVPASRHAGAHGLRLARHVARARAAIAAASSHAIRRGTRPCRTGRPVPPRPGSAWPGRPGRREAAAWSEPAQRRRSMLGRLMAGREAFAWRGGCGARGERNLPARRAIGPARHLGTASRRVSAARRGAARRR